MSELASQPPTTTRAAMPGRLRTGVAILVFQILANGLLGWLILDSLNQYASDGQADTGAGIGYVLGYASIALAAVLLVCVVGTVRPMAWVRPLIITIEVIAIIGGLVNLFTGTVTALLGIGLAITVITVLHNNDVQHWYEHGDITSRQR